MDTHDTGTITRRSVYKTSEFFKGCNGTLNSERTVIPKGENSSKEITINDVTVELCYTDKPGEPHEITVTVRNLSGIKLKVVEETVAPTDTNE